MSALNELEAISDLLTSPGWQWFCRYVHGEWGPSGLAYQQSVKAAAKDQNAVVELQKVLHTSEAMIALLLAPKSRLDALKQAALNELKEQRSRGGA